MQTIFVDPGPLGPSGCYTTWAIGLREGDQVTLRVFGTQMEMAAVVERITGKMPDEKAHLRPL